MYKDKYIFLYKYTPINRIPNNTDLDDLYY